jgi:iron donor protein CyaY
MADLITEHEFHVRADAALDALVRSLGDLADREGFEVELQGGVLNILFEEPTETRFVISPNTPVRQIWVSALVRSYKLSWSPDREAFVLDGETLDALMTRLVHTHLGH